MARSVKDDLDQDSGNDSSTDKAKTTKSSSNKSPANVKAVAHPKSGGSSKPAVAPKWQAAPRQPNQSTILHRAQWDDTSPVGEDKPYVFNEYPKHLTFKGVLHIVVSEDHEIEVRELHDKN